MSVPADGQTATLEQMVEWGTVPAPTDPGRHAMRVRQVAPWEAIPKPIEEVDFETVEREFYSAVIVQRIVVKDDGPLLLKVEKQCGHKSCVPSPTPIDEWSVHYVHPPRASREQQRPWADRPWHIRRWQVEDGKLARDQRQRTAPERLNPLDGQGVGIRCLVCLRPTGRVRGVGKTDVLRHDQVCGACEKDWSRTGRPWGTTYDAWLTKRRVAQWRKSGEHLAAYMRCVPANEWRARQSVRPPSAKIMPLTRGTTDMSFDAWDNGYEDGSEPASSF